MECGTVSAKELAEKGSLRAEDYLLNGRLKAMGLVKSWSDRYGGLLNMRGVPSKDLAGMISTALEEAYELGKKRGG